MHSAEPFHTFATLHTSDPPVSYRGSGSEAVERPVWAVDRDLAGVDQAFDFLFDVTPVNNEAAWNRFREDRYDRVPTLHYRPLRTDPTSSREGLFNIPVDRIEEPTLAGPFP